MNMHKIDMLSNIQGVGCKFHKSIILIAAFFERILLYLSDFVGVHFNLEFYRVMLV